MRPSPSAGQWPPQERSSHGFVSIWRSRGTLLLGLLASSAQARPAVSPPHPHSTPPSSRHLRPTRSRCAAPPHPTQPTPLSQAWPADASPTPQPPPPFHPPGRFRKHLLLRMRGGPGPCKGARDWLPPWPGRRRAAAHAAVPVAPPCSRAAALAFAGCIGPASPAASRRGLRVP